MSLKCLYQVGNSPTHSFIWFHGLGANAHDFYEVPLQWSFSNKSRFIFPNAPTLPVTLNQGFPMPSWYDILDLSEQSRKIDEKGLQKMNLIVHQLIEEEHLHHQIPYENIYLIGFSQGGSLALYSTLSFEKKLGGVIGLSTYLPIENPPEHFSNANQDTPILLLHGSEDNVVSMDLFRQSKKRLQKYHYSITSEVYPILHSVCKEELDLMEKWIIKHQ